MFDFGEENNPVSKVLQLILIRNLIKLEQIIWPYSKLLLFEVAGMTQHRIFPRIVVMRLKPTTNATNK